MPLFVVTTDRASDVPRVCEALECIGAQEIQPLTSQHKVFFTIQLENFQRVLVLGGAQRLMLCLFAQELDDGHPLFTPDLGIIVRWTEEVDWTDVIATWAEIFGHVPKTWTLDSKRYGPPNTPVLAIDKIAMQQQLRSCLHETLPLAHKPTNPDFLIYYNISNRLAMAAIPILVKRMQGPLRVHKGLHHSICWGLAFTAKLQPKEVVLDPMCGKGSILCEAMSFWPNCNYIGVDLDPLQVRDARDNVLGVSTTAPMHKNRPKSFKGRARAPNSRKSENLNTMTDGVVGGGGDTCPDPNSKCDANNDLVSLHDSQPECAATSNSNSNTTTSNFDLYCNHDPDPNLDPSSSAGLGSRHSMSKTHNAAIELLYADARALPLRDGSVDVVLCDLPFGRQHGSVDGNMALYPVVLHEITRVLKQGGRAVLLTNDLCSELLHGILYASSALHIVQDIIFPYCSLLCTMFLVVKGTLTPDNSANPKQDRAGGGAVDGVESGNRCALFDLQFHAQILQDPGSTWQRQKPSLTWYRPKQGSGKF